jgi:hypothetical protein
MSDESPEERRITRLARLWHNKMFYSSKPRTALEQIAKGTSDAAEVARKALEAPRPPSPYKGWGENGMFFTGHMYPEYYELPMRDYLDPDA